MTPYESAKSTCGALVLAFQLQKAFREKRILGTALKDSLIVFAGHELRPAVTLHGPTDDGMLEIQTHNLVVCAAAAAAIALDSALCKKHGRRPEPTALKADVDRIRFVIYMIRCAFAHNVTAPRWQVVPKGRVVVSVVGLTLGFSALNGLQVNGAHLGEVAGVARLAEFALRHCK